jgi:hypothetical protein
MMERLACSRKALSITGSAGRVALRFMADTTLARLRGEKWRNRQAARSMRMMYPGSRAAEHREHFWPGFTLAVLRVATTIPSTVCVQMGQ